MSNGTHVDLGWAGTGTARDRAANPAASDGNGARPGKYLTDEEILGIDPPSPAAAGGYGGQGPLANGNTLPAGAPLNGAAEAGRAAEMALGKTAPAEAYPTGTMPEWMQPASADPRHGAEAQQLWREHQEFRSAFASPEEARAIKELLPGGVRDVLSLREATQSVERIDAALFSGDARAQAEVVAELARANPAAFRSLFAEAAKVLGAGGGKLEAGIHAPDQINANGTEARVVPGGTENRRQDAGATSEKSLVDESHVTTHESQITIHQPPVTNHESQITNHGFDTAAYAAFERSTNDAVARDVRGSIGDTLARVLPDGVAEGAARRIGEDIFNEIHRALAADRTLSEQVAAVLRGSPSPNGGSGGWRFGGAEQQRVASLLVGRAKQLVPGVARRVIGEWTSSVMNTSRSKAARQAAAASRVDIAAPGGSLDSMPLRQMSRREVDYASMSDEEILGI